MEIPHNHPRFRSLQERHLLIDGYKKGLVADAGLIAHGRGEAFDYLLGERTHPMQEKAMRVAVAHLLRARHPVISVNGNTAALVGPALVSLSKEIGAVMEVNLFYYTRKRAYAIRDYLRKLGAEPLVGRNVRITGLTSPRGIVDRRGLAQADVVLLAIEDGDRTEYMKKKGAWVIAIDLNPLSRTATMADVTIVDNVTRCIPRMVEIAKEMKSKPVRLPPWNNDAHRARTLQYITQSLLSQARDLLRTHFPRRKKGEK